MSNLVNTNNLEKHRFDFNLAWVDYRKSVSKKSKRTKVSTEALFNKIVRECLKTIAYYWTNSTGGVYLKGAGYFFLFRPTKKFFLDNSKEYINNIYRTSGFNYLLSHTSLRPIDSFNGFKIRRPYKTIKDDARLNIIKGRRYTININILKSYLKRRDY